MESRFETILKEEDVNKIDYIKVFRDKQTGVLYVYCRDFNSGGLTVLVDKEGKPLTLFKANIKQE